jgi:hypothetical protein
MTKPSIVNGVRTRDGRLSGSLAFLRPDVLAVIVVGVVIRRIGDARAPRPSRTGSPRDVLTDRSAKTNPPQTHGETHVDDC